MKRVVASLLAISLTTLSPAKTHATSCDASIATKLPDSSAGRPIEFLGDDIGEVAMSNLWSLGQTWNTHDFGKAIAEAQDWFGECKYPGIGLGTGSGYSWHDRNVTLWIWADAVDLSQARATIFNLVQPAPTTTTSTTTTTTTTTVAAEPQQDVAIVAAVEHSPAEVTQVAQETSTTTTTLQITPVQIASVKSGQITLTKVVAPAKKKVVKKKIIKKKAVSKVK